MLWVERVGDRRSSEFWRGTDGETGTAAEGEYRERGEADEGKERAGHALDA